MKIILITCVAEKHDYPLAASILYKGELFKQLMDYAQAKNPDKTFILSGKYGLVRLNQVLEYYDVNLNEVSDEELQAWSSEVLAALAQEADFEKDEFILLCNPTYAKYLLPALKQATMPITIE